MTDAKQIDAQRIDPEPDLASEALNAMTSPNIAAVLQMRMTQIRDFGHSAEADDMHPLVHLPKTADEYLRGARVELHHIREDTLMGGHAQLEPALAKTHKAIAMLLASADQISRKIKARDREKQR